MGNKRIEAPSRDIAKRIRLVRFSKEGAKAEWMVLTGTDSDSRFGK